MWGARISGPHGPCPGPSCAGAGRGRVLPCPALARALSWRALRVCQVTGSRWPCGHYGNGTGGEGEAWRGGNMGAGGEPIPSHPNRFAMLVRI